MNDDIYDFLRTKLYTNKLGKNKEIVVEQFRKIINEHSLENDSKTPDFILAEYLYDCLQNANMLIGRRSMWYNPTDEK